MTPVQPPLTPTLTIAPKPTDIDPHPPHSKPPFSPRLPLPLRPRSKAVPVLLLSSLIPERCPPRPPITHHANLFFTPAMLPPRLAWGQRTAPCSRAGHCRRSMLLLLLTIAPHRDRGLAPGPGEERKGGGAGGLWERWWDLWFVCGCC